MPTLTINGGVLLGAPQVQPVQGIIQPISRVISAGSLPALTTPISVPRTILNTTTTASPQVTTLENIVKSAGLPDTVIVTPAKVNVITPSYNLTLEPGAYDPSRFDASVFTTKRLEPYEQLTGISQERPEIVMMTSFLPLFVNDINKSTGDRTEESGFYPFMTPAGRYIDAQLQSRNMRSMNMVGMLTRLRQQYEHLSAEYVNRHQSFTAAIDALSDTTAFLLTLMKGMNRLKEQLDLRDDLYDINTQDVARNQMLNGASTTNLASLETILAGVRRLIPLTYTMTDALAALGFDSDTVRSVFSSSKIWLQLMLELKIILQAHSLEFVDIDPASRRNDKNAASILRDEVKRFGLSQNILVPELNGITNVTIPDLSNVVSLINQGFQKVYEDGVLKSDDIKITSLVNLISKEFNYSHGLAKPSIQRILEDNLGFKVAQNDNRKLFDAVIGQVGTSISDVPATETNSLASVAQRQLTNNEVVLTFESKYVVGDAGTLTPGSRFFVDNALKTDGTKFDTTRIDELAFQLQGSYDRFNAITSGLNLLSRGSKVSSDNLDFKLILASQSDMVHYLLSQFVNTTSGETLTPVKNDNLSSIYAQALHDNQIKAILFVYTMCRISRSYKFNVPAFRSLLQADNTPVTDALVERLLETLKRNITVSGQLLSFADQSISSLSGRSLSGAAGGGTPIGSNVSFDAVRTAMKRGTALTTIVETIMSKVLAAFRADDGAIIGGKTRFGGDADTTIMMVMFDLLITMIARFNNQTIVSYVPAVASSVDAFKVSQTSTNHSDTIRDITVRIDRELALVQRLTYAALNTLKNLATTMQSFSSYLRNPSSVQKLKDVATVFSDTNMLQLLLSEQQIMVLASTVYDLKANLNRRDENGGTRTDEFLVLDNSNVTFELQRALYGLLGNGEFTLAKGFNKKVLTVGIPLGFSKHLQQSVKLNNLKKTSFVNKQNDIVSVVVYKTDLKNPDVVYKPQRFLFELSRFPVRGQQGYLDIPSNPTINDVVNAIPTRDFGQSLRAGYDPVYGAIAGDPITEGFKAAFADETYSFLTDAQKAEIIKNHVVSYLMEVYINLLTGINVADYHFDMVDPLPLVEPDFVKVLTEHRISQVVDLHSVAREQVVNGNVTATNRAGGILFSSTIPPVTLLTSQTQKTFGFSNPSGIAGAVDAVKQFSGILPVQPVTNISVVKKKVEQADSNLAAVSQRIVPGLVTDMQLINGFSRTITSLADGLAVSKRLLQPKQFDRVFNVIVDPDNFQVDYDQTVKTPYGKQALEKMIANGDVVPVEQNNQIFRRVLVGKASLTYGRNISLAGSALYHDRDKVPGDLAFEKYFVTVETLDESEQG